MSTNDNKNRKRCEEDKTLKYCICEQEWYNEQPVERRKELDAYGRYLVIVPCGFFDWVDTRKYKMELTLLAQMWLDFCGGTYVIDAARGEGYILERISEDSGAWRKCRKAYAESVFLDDKQLQAINDNVNNYFGAATP